MNEVLITPWLDAAADCTMQSAESDQHRFTGHEAYPGNLYNCAAMRSIRHYVHPRLHQSSNHQRFAVRALTHGALSHHGMAAETKIRRIRTHGTPRPRRRLD